MQSKVSEIEEEIKSVYLSGIQKYYHINPDVNGITVKCFPTLYFIVCSKVTTSQFGIILHVSYVTSEGSHSVWSTGIDYFHLSC